jgi:hypothetical protein
MRCDYCMQDHNSERYTNNQCPTCGAQKPWKGERPLQNSFRPGVVWVSEAAEDAIRAQQQNLQNAYGRGLQNQIAQHYFAGFGPR